MARKGKIEIGASVTVGAKEDGSLSKIEKRIEKLSNEEIEINIKDATKHLAELEKMEKMLGKKMAGAIEAQKKQFTDLIEQCKQEQKLRADNLKQIEQEVKAAKELQKIEEKTAKTQKQKNNGPTKREQELADITKSIKGIRGVVNAFDDPSIQKTEEKIRKLITALDEYQTKLDAMKRLRKGNERTMYDTAKSEIADLKRALGAIQAVKDQTPSIKPKIEKKEKEVEQEKPKKTTTQQTKAPVVGAGGSAKSIQEQTAAIKQQAGAMESLGKSAGKATKQVDSMFDPSKQKKYTDYISAQIKDTERLIKNQQAWIKHLGWVFEEDMFISSGKADAYDKLKLAAMRYNDASRDKAAGRSVSEDAIELATIAWKKAYDEAVKQGVAERRLYDYKPPIWNYDSSLKTVQRDYDYRKKALGEGEVKLTSLKQIQGNIEGFAQLCDVLGEYRQCVKDINGDDKALAESAAQKLEGIKKNLRVGIDIKDLDKQNALLDIRKKLRADGYSIEQIATDYISRIGFLGERVNKELKAPMQEFFETPSGQISMFEGMADPVFETVEATNELAGALKNVERIAGQISFDEYVKDIKDIVYHAGDLSNIDKTIKSLTLGHVKPQLSGGVYQGKYRSGSIFNGLTGLYTTEDLDSFIGNEWTGAPISSIDISKYKLFKPSSNEVATRVMDFFDELNGTIYGYLEYFDMDQPEMQVRTDMKPIGELYSEMQAIFGQVNVTVEEFTKWVNDSKAAIKGYKFVGREQPVLDEGISKVGYGIVLDGAPESLINADSFQTQLMKMLGFEGIDLRGTKYNGTYTGGTVIFDIKPESLRAVNEKYSDVMVRNGLYSAEEAKELVEFEEKRRQLAFETAKAFSKQALIQPTVQPNAVEAAIEENTGVAPVEVPVTPVTESKVIQNAIEESTDNSPVEVPIVPVVKKSFNAVEAMSQGMEARIARANALSQAGIDISRGSLLTNTDEAFKAILGGTSPKDAVQNIVWPMLMEQLKNAGYADYAEFDKMLSGINDKANWIKSPAPYWYHFGTQNQKFDEKIIRKAYGTFSDIGKLSSEVFTKLLDELVKRGFEGQIKIPRDITGFYNTDQLVGHASNKESFQALVEVFNKFKDSGLLSVVQTGIDANTKVLPFGKNASFTQMIEEIYRSAPGETFAVNEIRSIINGMVYSNNRKVGQALIQPLVDSIISARVPAIPEQTTNTNAQERLSQSASEAAEDTEKLAQTIQDAGDSAERTAEQIEKQSKSTQVSNNIINKLTKGVNIEQLLSKYGIPLDKLDTGVDLFKDLAGDIYQGSSGSEGFNRLFDFIAKNAERTEQVNKTLGEFYDYMSQVQIRIPENMEKTFEAENPDDWKRIKKLFAIGGNYQNKKRLITTSKYASTPDVLLEELISNGFGYALGVDKNFNGSAQDSLRLILDAVQRAKDEARLGKTQKIIGLNDEEQTVMATDLAQAVGIVEQNYLALSAAANEVSAANNDVAESAGRIESALDEQAESTQRATDATKDLQDQEQRQGQNDENPVFSADKIETEIDRIRNAIHSSEIGLDKIADTEGLQAAVAAYVKSLDEIDDKKFKLISADINEMAEGFDRVTLKFQSLEDENVKLAQTWAMNDGKLTLGRLRTTKTFVDSESNFDTELERTVANSKIDALESQLIGIDHVSQKVTDSLTSLRTAAGNISSDSDIKTFAKNFQVAQNYIKEFKNEYKTLGSLANETQNAQAKMANAQETINAQISSSAKYIGVDGYDKVTQSIDNMTSALSKYNEAQQKISDGGLDTEAIGKYEKQMADAFTEYNKAEKQLGAAMKEVRANASFDTFSKSMKDAETVIDTAKLKLDKFGDLDGVDKANGYIEDMTAAWKKFNDTDSTIEDKAQAVKDFTSANESFTKQVQYLNEVQKNTPKEEPVSSIQTYYEQYVSAIKDLNNVNQQLFAYQGKNESGVYNGLIEQLQQQKIRILAQLQDINSSVEEEVLNIYNPISMDGDKYKFDLSRYLDVNTADTIKEFFNNASVEAELGAESIQKFIDVAMQSQKIDAAFGEGVAKQYKSINDLHESTKEFASAGAEQIFKSIQAGIAVKLTSGTNWTQEQENRLQSLIETYTEYATAIDKAVQKERKILNAVDNKNILRGDSLDLTKDVEAQMVDQVEKMRQATGATAASIDDFDEVTGRLTFTLDGADGKARTFTMSMTELGHVAVAQVKNIDKVKTGWDEFKGSLGGVGKQLLQYGLRMVEVYDIIRYLRQGFNEVLQIDTAMTELKKVTDETAVAYRQFLKDSVGAAREIGSTLRDFTEATSNFARLGLVI